MTNQHYVRTSGITAPTQSPRPILLELRSEYQRLLNEFQEKRNELARLLWKRRTRQVESFKKRSEQRAFQMFRQECEQLIKWRQEILRESSGECLRLALDLSKEVLGEQVLASEAHMKKRVELALSKLESSPALEIFVAPEQIGLANKVCGNIGIVKPCSELSLGEIRISTISGSILSSWKVELSELQKHLEEQVISPRGSES